MSRAFRGVQVSARTFQGVKELARSRLLDDPSEPNDVLDALMSKAVTALYLSANGASMPLVERVTNGNKQHNGPGDDVTCHRLLVAFERARTHRERLMLILTAQEEERRARLVDKAKVCGTDEWERAVARDPRSLRAVGTAYGISHEQVRTIKARVAARATVKRLDKV